MVNFSAKLQVRWPFSLLGGGLIRTSIGACLYVCMCVLYTRVLPRPPFSLLPLIQTDHVNIAGQHPRGMEGALHRLQGSEEGAEAPEGGGEGQALAQAGGEHGGRANGGGVGFGYVDDSDGGRVCVIDGIDWTAFGDSFVGFILS